MLKAVATSTVDGEAVQCALTGQFVCLSYHGVQNSAEILSVGELQVLRCGGAALDCSTGSSEVSGSCVCDAGYQT